MTGSDLAGDHRGCDPRGRAHHQQSVLIGAVCSEGNQGCRIPSLFEAAAGIIPVRWSRQPVRLRWSDGRLVAVPVRGFTGKVHGNASLGRLLHVLFGAAARFHSHHSEQAADAVLAGQERQLEKHHEGDSQGAAVR